MTGLLGLRVMRGPGWDQGTEDGGEGHLGTVKQLLSNRHVLVLWDTGQESTCRAGADGKFDLMIFDTAPAGVRHPGSRCAECGDTDIYGMLWRCQECPGCDLCPQCYSDDKHDIRHRFLRIDHYQSEGQSVKKRKVSVRMRAMGIFAGAKVTRGPDWAWADQDGGPGSEGEVMCFENVAPDSARNLVRVQWQGMGKGNSYRLGFHGNVDLQCVDEEVGPFYYRDHLPLLDADSLPYPLAPKDTFTAAAAAKEPADASIATATEPPTTTTATSLSLTGVSNPSIASSTSSNSSTSLASASSQQQQQQQQQPQEVGNGQEEGAIGGAGTATEGPGESTDAASEVGEEVELSLAVGDKVMMGVNENQLRDLQEDYGGVSDGMIKRLGQKGVVMEVATGVLVRFTSSTYRLNPLALVKVPSLKEGDAVRIRRDASQVKLLNKHIAWNQQIADTCGSMGRVVRTDKDEAVTVTFGHYQTFTFCPACCLPLASGTAVDLVGVMAGARKAAVAGAERAAAGAAGGAGAGARSSPGPEVGTKGNPSLARKAAATVGNPSSGAVRASAWRREVPAGGAGCAGGGGDAASARVLTNYGNDNANRDGKNNAGTSDSDSDLQRLLQMMGLTQGGGNSDCDNDFSDPKVKVLFSAINNGDTRAVETLLRTDMSLLTKTHQQFSPLHYACHEGQCDITTLLLDLGADMEAHDKIGRTPLLVALDRRKEDTAILMLERGANPQARNIKGRTALHEAAFEDLRQALQMLIFLGADVNAKDIVQDTPLFDAIEKGRSDSVEILLQAPTLDYSQRNAQGFNMLQLAALKGQARCIELILARDQCPPVEDMLDGRYTALHIAANNDHVECIGILVLIGAAMTDIGDGWRQLTPLHLACKRRMIKAAEALVQLGATVNVCDVDGNTPLHLAMGKILENDRDDSDVSLDTAVEHRTRMACLLISNGANVDVVDRAGMSPLQCGHTQVKDNVRRFLDSEKGTTGSSQESKPPGVPIISVGEPKDIATIEDDDGGTVAAAPGKQDDPQHLSALLEGVSVQCASCDAMSDVTLEPCGHKCVCRKCCDVITVCPVCGTAVEEKEPDNTDEQDEDDGENKDEDDDEKMNTFD